MKTGLLMEGGAMRGMFTAGVIDLMMEEGITFDGAIGVSAGAAFGCNFKSGQIGRAFRYNSRFCGDKRYCSIKSLIKTGDLYNVEFCYRTIPYKLDPFDINAFNANSMEFYVVCTDVETGEGVYYNCSDGDSAVQWMRASASMPLAARIVDINGRKLLDGGVSDSIPLKRFEELGYKKNVVILTQPEGYVKKKNSLLWLMKLAYRKYPSLYKAIKNRHIVYNDSLLYVKEREQSGDALVIRPPAPLPVSRTEKDPTKLKAAYNIGRRACKERLDEIKCFLA